MLHVELCIVDLSQEVTSDVCSWDQMCDRFTSNNSARPELSRVSHKHPNSSMFNRQLLIIQHTSIQPDDFQHLRMSSAASAGRPTIEGPTSVATFSAVMGTTWRILGDFSLWVHCQREPNKQAREQLK